MINHDDNLDFCLKSSTCVRLFLPLNYTEKFLISNHNFDYHDRQRTKWLPQGKMSACVCQEAFICQAAAACS